MENKILYNTLFLDRDGVINVHRPGDYVKSIAEFVFIDGVQEALRMLSPLFRHIVIVTNQRGVEKGIFSRQDLETIHRFMIESVAANGGRIDRIYVSTALVDSHPDRKPNPGMALQAKKDFPDMDFANSRMVGDSASDMLFAQNAGIPAIWIGNQSIPQQNNTLPILAHYPDLITFAHHISTLIDK
jgi:D-glycero-D-manno-heptose 1,7-bisphosphate phosphatase/D-glycero-alpha-D-manno-heptose 1-phosphate guanylyltransferase